MLKNDIQFYRKCIKSYKIVIANSKASKVMLVKRFGIDENKIQIVYNGFFHENFNYVPL